MPLSAFAENINDAYLTLQTIYKFMHEHYNKTYLGLIKLNTQISYYKYK